MFRSNSVACVTILVLYSLTNKWHTKFSSVISKGRVRSSRETAPLSPVKLLHGVVTSQHNLKQKDFHNFSENTCWFGMLIVPMEIAFTVFTVFWRLLMFTLQLMQIKKEILRGLEVHNLKIWSGPSVSFCYKANVF